MAYRKRVFLNPISLNAPSFIQAVADSSYGGTDRFGNYVLIIADCHRNIVLDFSLETTLGRKLSLAKIDRLAKVINEFRDAVHAEAKLIDDQNTL